MADGRHIENRFWLPISQCHICLISAKFGGRMQNLMQIQVTWRK